MSTVTIYFIAWCFSTILYLWATNVIRKHYKKTKEKDIELTRRICLEKQYTMLMDLHEIQENYPNVSRSDTAMMNAINYYIEETASKLRNLDNKKSYLKSVATDNSI